MKRVSGIGGIFFKSKDPATLTEWYRQHLGIESAYGAASFRWLSLDGKPASTVWSPFKQETRYFDPSTAGFMINYRVDDLDATLAALRAAGVTVDEKTEDSEYGRFGWAMDPDGNRLELWEDVGAKGARVDARAAKPAREEYGDAHEGYIAEAPEGDIVETLRAQMGELDAMLSAVEPEREQYRYAPGKWTITQLAGHLIDAERVFSYRLMSISRNETQSLPGFDEQSYMASSNYEDRPLRAVADEWLFTRGSHVAMLAGLSDSMWSRRGTANGVGVSVRALAWITAGHTAHHMKILRERYLA